MRTYADYLHFLSGLCQLFAQLTAIEEKKAEAVRQRDLDALNECMKQEQAVSLSLRGHEQRRREILQDLGLQNIPMREVPRHCPPEQRQAVSDAVEQVLRAHQVLSSAQASARMLLENQLHLTEKELQRRGVDPDDIPPLSGRRQGAAGTDITI